MELNPRMQFYQQVTITPKTSYTDIPWNSSIPDLWLVEIFSTTFLKLLNGIQRNLTGSKIFTSSTKFVFFELFRKPRCLPYRLSIKVALCTEVHDMWPFGLLLWNINLKFCLWFCYTVWISWHVYILLQELLPFHWKLVFQIFVSPAKHSST